MPDTKTRDKIARVLREECPIPAINKTRGVKTECPRMGPSGDCGTCTYAWQSVADDVIVMVSNRAKNTETERKRRLKAEKAVQEIRGILDEFYGRNQESECGDGGKGGEGSDNQ